MAKYSVGQRVRIKYAVRSDNQHLVGKETHITDLKHVVWRDDNFDGTGYKVAVVANPLPTAWWREGQLEPIIPEGSAPSEFKDIHELLDSLQLEVVK